MVAVKNGGLLAHSSVLLALVFKLLSDFKVVDKLLVGSEVSHSCYIVWFSLSLTVLSSNGRQLVRTFFSVVSLLVILL